MVNKYPRKSQDSVLFQDVLISGMPTSVFHYALTQGIEPPDPENAELWAPPAVTPQGYAFILTSDMEWGFWKVWVKIVTQDLRPIVVEGPRFLIY